MFIFAWVVSVTMYALIFPLCSFHLDHAASLPYFLEKVCWMNFNITVTNYLSPFII